MEDKLVMDVGKNKNGIAIAALVLGIISLLTLSGAIILSVVAIVLAVRSKRGAPRMCGKAKAGMICAIIGIVLGVLTAVGFSLLLYILIEALKAAGEGFGNALGDALSESLRG